MPVSAMDGYAVRAADVVGTPVELPIVGYAPAGGSYDKSLNAGEAVRIFTGAPVPEGADAIVIKKIPNSAAKPCLLTRAPRAVPISARPDWIFPQMMSQSRWHADDRAARRFDGRHERSLDDGTDGSPGNPSDGR